MKSLRLALIVSFSLWILFPTRAQAYIDPGTGSYIIQLLIAGILGALFAVKLVWRKVVLFFKGLFERRQKFFGP